MYQLRQKGLINQLVMSAYLSVKPGNGTHIKFGGYDEEGMEGGAEAVSFLQTDDATSWAVGLSDVSVGDSTLDVEDYADDGRLAIFELAYPYIYMPMKDFNEIAKLIN